MRRILLSDTFQPAIVWPSRFAWKPREMEYLPRPLRSTTLLRMSAKVL